MLSRTAVGQAVLRPAAEVASLVGQMKPIWVTHSWASHCPAPENPVPYWDSSSHGLSLLLLARGCSSFPGLSSTTVHCSAFHAPAASPPLPNKPLSRFSRYHLWTITFRLPGFSASDYKLIGGSFLPSCHLLSG